MEKCPCYFRVPSNETFLLLEKWKIYHITGFKKFHQKSWRFASPKMRYWIGLNPPTPQTHTHCCWEEEEEEELSIVLMIKSGIVLPSAACISEHSLKLFWTKSSFLKCRQTDMTRHSQYSEWVSKIFMLLLLKPDIQQASWPQCLSLEDQDVRDIIEEGYIHVLLVSFPGAFNGSRI